LYLISAYKNPGFIPENLSNVFLIFFIKSKEINTLTNQDKLSKIPENMGQLQAGKNDARNLDILPDRNSGAALVPTVSLINSRVRFYEYKKLGCIKKTNYV